MSLLTAVTSSAALATNDVVTLYTCPNTKSHAIVDIIIFKPNANAATFEMAVSTTAVGSLVETDYILKNVAITTENESFFINKVTVGRNESIYVKATAGAFNIRMAGIEENNPNIGLAGKIRSINFTGVNPVEAYKTVTPNTVLSVATLSVRNSNAGAAVIDLYVTSGAVPTVADLINKLTVSGGQYATYTNIFVKPNEAIYVKSSLDNVYFNVIGFVQVVPA